MPLENIMRAPSRQGVSQYRYFDLLVSIFIMVLLISNALGQKICAIGPFRLGGAEILFPVAYIFGDVFTEVYGYAASRRAIWLGFLASCLMAVITAILVALPPAPDWPDQAIYAKVFLVVPRMVIASLLAYGAGEFTNSYVMAKMKVWTGGKWLWTRTVGSTVTGQAVDTTVFMVLAFSGRVEGSVVANLVFSSYLAKVLYEVLATPLTYAVVNFLKRREGIDVFDDHTRFNPFRFGEG